MEENVLRNQICLAILPMQMVSEDPRLEMFCQGLVMDLITDLSRFRSLEIIAYGTSRAISPDEPSGSPDLEKLNLDYLVRGLVRSSGDALQLNIQLIRLPNDRLVWSEKFRGGFDKLFDIQEAIVQKIVVSLHQSLGLDLLQEIRKKPITQLRAYECWLRGYDELKRGTPESDDRARACFQKAMEIDPHYARAYTGMSLSYFNEWSCQLWSRWDASRSGAYEWAKRALELDEWDHVSNAILGRVLLYGAEYDKSEHFLRKSLRINANDPETLLLISVGFTYLGYAAEAGQLLERALRLNPAEQLSVNACSSFVHFEMGDFEESIALAERHELGHAWVDFAAFQAAAYYYLDDLEKMKERWDSFLAEFSRKINGGKPADTAMALQWMINVNPYRGETRLRPFWEYLARTDPVEMNIEPSKDSAFHANRFAREGEIWSISYEGKDVQISDRKGLHDLARLLRQPNDPVHCTELMGALIMEQGEAVFDRKAQAAYRRRLLELQEDIESARAALDEDRLIELQEEYDQLLDDVSRMSGVGGKARKSSGTVEKSRAAATWRIRDAIRKINEVHPALGNHLQRSIRTGVFCEYSPEHEVTWQI